MCCWFQEYNFYTSLTVDFEKLFHMIFCRFLRVYQFVFAIKKGWYMYGELTGMLNVALWCPSSIVIIRCSNYRYAPVVYYYYEKVSSLF